MKINFSKEHKASLDALVLAMLYSGQTLKTALGGELNIHQLLHETSIKSLQSFYGTTLKEIENQTKTDKWSMTDYQQNKLVGLQKMSELLDLLIGYKKSEEVKKTNAASILEKRKVLNQLKEEKKTPDERIAELAAELAALESE